MNLLCRFGRHKWDLFWRTVGDRVPCERGCGAVAVATEDGWVLERPGREPQLFIKRHRLQDRS
jgi:hypothetical protein